MQSSRKHFSNAGNLTSARRELEQAVELSPETAEYHCSLANALAGLDDTENAMLHYKKSIEDYFKGYIDFGKCLSKRVRPVVPVVETSC